MVQHNTRFSALTCTVQHYCISFMFWFGFHTLVGALNVFLRYVSVQQTDVPDWQPGILLGIV